MYIATYTMRATDAESGDQLGTLELHHEYTTARKILARLRAFGWLPTNSKGRVRVDYFPEKIIVCKSSTAQPLITLKTVHTEQHVTMKRV